MTKSKVTTAQIGHIWKKYKPKKYKLRVIQIIIFICNMIPWQEKSDIICLPEQILDLDCSDICSFILILEKKCQYFRIHTKQKLACSVCNQVFASALKLAKHMQASIPFFVVAAAVVMLLSLWHYPFFVNVLINICNLGTFKAPYIF